MTKKLVIVGSGPAGLTAAIYSARAGLDTTIIGGSITAGGALMNTTEVENFPGFPQGVMGPELIGRMQEQAEKFGAVVINDDVIEFSLADDVKTLQTAGGESYSADAIILALGSEYRKLGVPGEAELSAKGVSYCATCDGFFFRDQHLIVVGGGDTAMEEATFLTRFASKVTLIHRREDFRASEFMVNRAKNDPKIEFVMSSVVNRINGTGKVESVTVENLLTGEITELAAGGIFVAIGQDPRTPVLNGGVNLDAGGFIEVEGRSSRTNVPGVFACGDVVDREYRQAITAAGSGCAAALDALEYLESKGMAAPTV
jgi:thioredoxin reductase (NADPH)